MMENPYQSFLDWVLGRWTCPNCGETWRSHASPFFCDCTLATIKRGEVVERRVECLGCGFKEIIKGKT